MKNLLIETNLFEGRINEDASGRTLVKGVLQRAVAENQNGRIYPREILMREAKKYEVLIKERRALGELDHPDSSVINLKNVSHNIKEIWWEGDDLCGTVEILPTPSGNILKELLRAGILLGISSRGMGSVTPMGEGKVKVGDDFELIGWDFVSNPSTHGAFMVPMNESVNKQLQEQAIVCGDYCKAQDLMREIITELS
jgi:Prohead core protein serine protease